MIYLITGLPGSGKTTLSKKIYSILESQGIKTVMLDGDNIRKCWPELGYSELERNINVARFNLMAKAFHDSGLSVIISMVAPSLGSRKAIRSTYEKHEFCEIYLDKVHVRRDELFYPNYEEDLDVVEVIGQEQVDWLLDKLES